MDPPDAEAPVYFLLEVDLAHADVDLFDKYESLALPVLHQHGGVVEARVRDPENELEWHLLRLPDEASWCAFRDDPRRRAHDWLLRRANVQVARYAVVPVPVERSGLTA